MQGGIYKIENKITKDLYIGQTNNFEKRKKQHFSALRNNRHKNYKMQKDILEYGIENFEFEIIKKENDIFKKDYFESYYSEKYNPTYNIKKLKKSKDIKKVYKNYYIYKEKIMKIINKLIKEDIRNIDVKINDIYKITGIKNIDELYTFVKCFDYDNNYNLDKQISINLEIIHNESLNINFNDMNIINRASSKLWLG